MKIGFVWCGISQEEYQLAKLVHDGRHERWRQQFVTVATIHISKRTIKETFTSVFDFAKTQQLDYCILSYRSAWVIHPQQLKILIESEEVQRSAFAVRAGKIYAKAGVFSPKMPYVDSDFIIVNVRRCAELDIPKCLATVLCTSHFSDAGGIHADLVALSETIVPYGALYVYDDGNALRDMYGRMRSRGFAPASYLIDIKRGLISCDPVCNPCIHSLRAILLRQYGVENTPLLVAYMETHAIRGRQVYMNDGAPFFVVPWTIRFFEWVGQRVKHLLSHVNFEIHKKYE